MASGSLNRVETSPMHSNYNIMIKTFLFDVRVFNPGATSNRPFRSAYHCHEIEKRRQYEQCVHDVEHGHFTPLVFTTTGGMGNAAEQVYMRKRLAGLLSDKHDLSYGEVDSMYTISFALVRSAIMYIRSASFGDPDGCTDC